MAYLAFKIAIFLCASCYCYAQIGVPFFRKDYTLVRSLNAFYKEHKDKQKWSDALAICREEGAELFMPFAKFELEAISTLLTKSKYWLGYQDIYSEGNFMTPDGRSGSEVYENWAEGEPNNSGDGENCVAMHNDTTYNDANCKDPLNYVCKKHAITVTRNEVCQSHDLGYKYTDVTDHCYKFHTNPSTWQEAFRICKNEEASLAIINSQREAKLFVSMFDKYPADSLKGNFDKNAMHLGFNELLNPGIFHTTTGQTLAEAGYDNWSVAFMGWSQQPDHLFGAEHCGSMFRDGTLNDINCDVRTMFICEKTLSLSSGLNRTPGRPLATLPDQE